MGDFRGMTLQLEDLVQSEGTGQSGEAEEVPAEEPLEEALKLSARPAGARSGAGPILLSE